MRRFERAVLREALTLEFHTPQAKLVWALRLGLTGLALHALAVTPQYTTRPLLVGTALLGLGVSLAFAFIPTKRPRTLKAAEAGLLLAVMAHVAGHSFGLYANFPYYDKVLHLVVPLAVALILYALSQATRWTWDWREVRPLEVGIYLFALTAAFGGAWELAEFGMDSAFGAQEQNGNGDTMSDLLADYVGALVGATLAGLATRYASRHGDALVEDAKRDAPRRASSPGARARE